MDIHSLLQISINEYTDIRHLMESIADPAINRRIEELNKTGEKLLKKQKRASQTDEKIMQLLHNSPHLYQEKKVVERTQLLQIIVDLNKRILPKLKSIQSLVSSELKQIKNGRSAMKGYQQNEKTNGKNVNETL